MQYSNEYDLCFIKVIRKINIENDQQVKKVLAWLGNVHVRRLIHTLSFYHQCGKLIPHFSVKKPYTCDGKDLAKMQYYKINNSQRGWMLQKKKMASSFAYLLLHMGAEDIRARLISLWCCKNDYCEICSSPIIALFPPSSKIFLPAKKKVLLRLRECKQCTIIGHWTTDFFLHSSSFFKKFNFN